jgi:hypothetical protein
MIKHTDDYGAISLNDLAVGDKVMMRKSGFTTDYTFRAATVTKVTKAQVILEAEPDLYNSPRREYRFSRMSGKQLASNADFQPSKRYAWSLTSQEWAAERKAKVAEKQAQEKRRNEMAALAEKIGTALSNACHSPRREWREFGHWNADHTKWVDGTTHIEDHGSDAISAAEDALKVLREYFREHGCDV